MMEFSLTKKGLKEVGDRLTGMGKRAANLDDIAPDVERMIRDESRSQVPTQRWRSFEQVLDDGMLPPSPEFMQAIQNQAAIVSGKSIEVTVDNPQFQITPEFLEKVSDRIGEWVVKGEVMP